MTFAVLSLTTVLMAISLRRSLVPGWAGPYIPYWLWMAIPAVLTGLCIELPLLQKIVQTTSLTGSQWMAVLLACMITPTVIEITKAIQRSRVQSAVSR